MEKVKAIWEEHKIKILSGLVVVGTVIGFIIGKKSSK